MKKAPRPSVAKRIPGRLHQIKLVAQCAARKEFKRIMRPDLISACRDRVLKSREKVVLLILATFADNGSTTPRLLVTTLAELSGFSKRTVQRALNGLAGEGLVQRHSAYRRPNSFTISIDSPVSAPPVVAPAEVGDAQALMEPERVPVSQRPTDEPVREPDAASIEHDVTVRRLQLDPEPQPTPNAGPQALKEQSSNSETAPNQKPSSATTQEPGSEPEIEVDEGALAEALQTVGEFWEIHGRGRRFIRDHVARLVAAGWDSDAICRWLGPRTEDVRNPFGVIKHRLDRLRNLEPPFKDGSLPQRRHRCWTCNTPTDNDTRYCDVCTAEQAKPRTKNRSWRDIAEEEGATIPERPKS
ncbi:helix-turn-helix domain-containing protein [Salininema proteolyticum]|uniref:Helix-turn-helix domain-containing protein n=1 Tax=Salininema proteolyticum TaxID=1607685 RepID=A0ABV8U4T5_9ACTN